MPDEFDLRLKTWVDLWLNPMNDWTNYTFRQSTKKKPTIQIPNLPIAPPEEIDVSSDIDEVNLESSTAEKFQNSTFGKNFNAWNVAANAANNIMTGIVGDKMFGGPKGHITQAIDLGWDTASDVVMKFGPYGQMAGLAMKGINVLNKGVNAALGSAALDNMTTTDAVLNNPLLGWNVGLINALGGQAADTITKNDEAFAAVGSSYGGTESTVGDALEKSGKKYGAFSNGARLAANREIAEAKRQLNIMSNIADEATNRFAIRDAMSSIVGNKRAFDLLGGYRQQAVHFGRNGMIMAKRAVSKYKMQERRKNFTSSQLKNQELLPEMVEEFKEGGEIDNISILVEVDIDSLPEEFKDGGVLGSSIIKEVEIEEMVEEFKEGGSFNVIPEGALHARLHHMENAENLTKKGIPVVSEKEGGELEQHAEIEKEEIILRLSLTKRLEELAKEDTDEAALEAGKILVEEILNNTIDNTNTLL